MKKVFITVVITAALVFVIALAGRYGWKLAGFAACESAGIEEVEVTDGQVKLKGFYPGSFPQGFLGYHAEQKGETLYVGFKFSGLFGIFETGDFDVTIPVEGAVSQVVVKTGNNEYPVWPQETDEVHDETEAKETVISDAYNVILEQYRTALSEQWSGQQFVDAGLNYMVRDVGSASVGYGIADLDGDGIAELTIGTISGDDFYGKLVFSLYSLNEDGEVLLIFSSTERNRYYYAGENCFAHLGSSGADDSFETSLKLEKGKLIDMETAIDPEEYVQMELMPIVRREG